MAGRRAIREVVIAGGGVMGLSTAFHLTQFISPSRITVVEPDPTYVRSATALSWASIREQFSLPENIALSQHSIRFIRDINNILGSPEDPVDINFKEGSYLFLATPETAPVLAENIAVQKAAGVHVNTYTGEELREKYPYMNTEDIALASDVSQNEGWFDPWLLLSAFRRKVLELGVEIVRGRVVGFGEDRTLRVEQVSDGGSTHYHYGQFVNATGIHAAFTNELLNRVLPSDQRFTLPVTPQKRQTFTIACRDGPRNVPLLLCPLGTVIRSEGPNYIVQHSDGTFETDEQMLKDFGDVDDSIFTEQIWENLAYRMPAFEATKVLSGWVGYYEYNTFDQNALVGHHPTIPHHFNINGFSGHGIQQAPTVGRCLAEIMVGEQPIVDISNFSLQRVVENRPYRERNIL